MGKNELKPDSYALSIMVRVSRGEQVPLWAIDAALDRMKGKKPLTSDRKTAPEKKLQASRGIIRRV